MKNSKIMKENENSSFLKPESGSFLQNKSTTGRGMTPSPLEVYSSPQKERTKKFWLRKIVDEYDSRYLFLLMTVYFMSGL